MGPVRVDLVGYVTEPISQTIHTGIFSAPKFNQVSRRSVRPLFSYLRLRLVQQITVLRVSTRKDDVCIGPEFLNPTDRLIGCSPKPGILQRAELV